MCERIIQEIAKTSDLKFFILRYFNVSGADPLNRSGQINDNATHLIKVCIEYAETTAFMAALINFISLTGVAIVRKTLVRLRFSKYDVFD